MTLLPACFFMALIILLLIAALALLIYQKRRYSHQIEVLSLKSRTTYALQPKYFPNGELIIKYQLTQLVLFTISDVQGNLGGGMIQTKAKVVTEGLLDKYLENFFDKEKDLETKNVLGTFVVSSSDAKTAGEKLNISMLNLATGDCSLAIKITELKIIKYDENTTKNTSQ